MLSQLNIKYTGKNTVKTAILASIVALAITVFATPVTPVLASDAGVQCPAGSPGVDIPAKAALGQWYAHTSPAGIYRIEVVDGHAWRNHPDKTKARWHGSSFYAIKNAPVIFGPDNSPVTKPLGGKRVANGTLYFDSLKLDPPFNTSGAKVAAAALGIDQTIHLAPGDGITFVVNAIYGINPNLQGSFDMNVGDVRVRVCAVSLDENPTTPTPTPGITAQCSDGLDNDGDGAIDMNDFSCSNPQDNDETLPKAQCQDTADNDSDNKIDNKDGGCHTDGNANNDNSYNAQDNSEATESKNAGLNVIKNPDRSVTRPGHEFTYNITIENTGNVDLDDVKVTDSMPSVLEIVSISDGGDKDGQTVTWKNLSIDAGQKKTVHITVRVKSNASNQTISNSVTVKSEDGDVEDSDTDTDIQVHPKAVEAAITVVPIKTVPVSAKTGATLPLMSVITLTGGATTFALKRYFI